jgi:hypothetical protein
MRQAIVNTSLEHGLVSRYTAFVAVDWSVSRPGDAPLRREAVPSLLPHGQSMQAIFGLPDTATGAGLRRLAGLVAVLLGLLVLRLRHTVSAERRRAAAASA